MVFSSPIFLFLFLPVLLALYYFAHLRYRNMLLFIGSLIFYAWGEPYYVLLMLASILFNWSIGLAIAKVSTPWKFTVLSVGVSIDLLILAYYKYFYFLCSSLAALLHIHFNIEPVILPIGVSFFTFHTISYIVDIYRGQGKALSSPLDMGLYISLFPQLVAGPIIRYHDIAQQLLERKTTVAQFSSGVERFVFGLGKKVIIANTLGQIADLTFSIPIDNLSAATAWFGLICYTLQIYFDFSGYSDMAIGLARLFGFELTENFNYPYIACSIREFWRRWHLSLSTWFRDYLYIPLGGNRGSWLRVRFNLFIVFFFCGLWHGASWNFAIWGMFHGMLLVVERGRFGSIIDAWPTYLARIYTLLMVMIGWVFFKAETLNYALLYLKTMFVGGISTGFDHQIEAYLNISTFLMIAIGIVASTRLFIFISSDWKSRNFTAHAQEHFNKLSQLFNFVESGYGILTVRSMMVIFILMVSMAKLATSTYNPFIYFRF